MQFKADNSNMKQNTLQRPSVQNPGQSHPTVSYMKQYLLQRASRLNRKSTMNDDPPEEAGGTRPRKKEESPEEAGAARGKRPRKPEDTPEEA